MDKIAILHRSSSGGGPKFALLISLHDNLDHWTRHDLSYHLVEQHIQNVHISYYMRYDDVPPEKQDVEIPREDRKIEVAEC